MGRRRSCLHVTNDTADPDTKTHDTAAHHAKVHHAGAHDTEAHDANAHYAKTHNAKKHKAESHETEARYFNARLVIYTLYLTSLLDSCLKTMLLVVVAVAISWDVTMSTRFSFVRRRT